jgi:hypothetical protein
MKKAMWANQMNTESIQAVQVIKRQRNARKLSLSEPEDIEHLSRVLRSIETLKI